MEGAARGNLNPGREAESVDMLSRDFPAIRDVLQDLGVPLDKADSASLKYVCEEAGVDTAEVFARLATQPEAAAATESVETLTIVPGRDKSGRPEKSSAIEICRGEIVAIVGVTGSGKSQLLSDIEGLVQGDSPSGRAIRLNGRPVDHLARLTQPTVPIAHISQAMHYLLDLSVAELLELHIESRGLEKAGAIRKAVVASACELCGEPFGPDARVVSLSGGQARALMIADAIHVTRSPVILVDEIENAGIDKERAIALLLESSAISIIATHDPLIALMAQRRIVLKNGAMTAVVRRSPAEAKTLERLRSIDEEAARLRTRLREGLEVTLVAMERVTECDTHG